MVSREVLEGTLTGGVGYRIPRGFEINQIPPQWRGHPSAMTSEFINRVVGSRYRLVAQLATGGMGVTYRAWDLHVGGPVVLKMPRRRDNDPEGREFALLAARFAREVEVMNAMAHKHIVPIIDHGDDDGTPFVVMRFLPGGALADHRKKTPSGDWQPTPAGQLYRWLPSVAEALDFIHSKSVVHRDIKPANIFLDGFSNAFLGDFGIAKIVGDESGLERGQTLTATHLAIGTPEYMAPELLSPKAKTDGRADQYALAISTYELISGRRPFTGTTAHIVIEHASHPVPPLDRKRLDIPSSLAAAIDRALAKNPDNRFPSCMEFVRFALADVTPQPCDPEVVRLLCPACRKVLRIPHTAGGREGNCPSCKQFMEIGEDFSALWLKSEATLVTDPPATPSSVSTLGTLDAEPAVVGQRLPQSTSGIDLGKQWLKGNAARSAMLVTSIIAACVGALLTHWRWNAHHSQVMQQVRIERELNFNANAAALKAAESDRIKAVRAVRADWEAKLEDLKAKLKAINDSPAEKTKTLNRGRENTARQVVQPNTLLAFTNSIGVRLVLIPSGSFVMGDKSGEANEREHTVKLTESFYIGVVEVTNAQWKRVMGDPPSRWKGDNQPVESVQWEDAEMFCRRLSELPEEKRFGHVYRLPTEAEWEYACRSGTSKGDPFGDESHLEKYAWFNRNSRGETHDVGLKWMNSWGLYDMHGNVREWCSDWYGEYLTDEETDPRGPPRAETRVVRGGCFADNARYLRAAARMGGLPTVASRFCGFRLAMSVPSPRQTHPELSNEPQSVQDEAAGGVGGQGTAIVPPRLPAIKNSIGMELQWIPSGEFVRVVQDGFTKSQSRVRVTKPFYIGLHEVTYAQWRRVMKGARINPLLKAGSEDLPADAVSWEQAAEFCRRLTSLAAERKAGRLYRLPTEAEWEYACRAGTTTTYSFGDDINQLEEFGWHLGKVTHPVGQKRPNPWGLYDMHGNVWEWCADWHDDYAAGTATDPAGPPQSPTGHRVARGGGCNYPTPCFASEFRGRFEPEDHFERVGFRVVLTTSENVP